MFSSGQNRSGVLQGLACGLALFLCANATAASQPQTSVFSKGPYIQAPAAGQVSIMWESLSNYSATVWFGTQEPLTGRVDEVVLREMTSASRTLDKKPGSKEFYVHEAALPGLQPGTQYSYTVESAEQRTPVRQFRTLDPNAERVRFIAYGDTRSTPAIHTALASRFLAHEPDLVLHTGDLVARGEDYDLWSREFFRPLKDVIERVPLFSVMGNHEHDGTNYLAYFHLPGRELWYSVDAGPVHVLALDFRYEKEGQEQLQFAREDLLSNHSPWKIVLIHTPLFNVGGHASHWGQDAYLPLLRQAKVDLVLAGHSHMYERFRPLARTNTDWAITHITTGGGGADLHTALQHPALVTQETTNHYMAFEADRETLRGEALRADGTRIDQFELRKSHGEQPADYLAQLYPEEAMQLFFEAHDGLSGRAARVPTETNAAPVLLTVQGRTAPRAPAELEITLTPDSAVAYELVNGPLHRATPAPGVTNWLWAEVKAKPGHSISQNRGRELVPALVFQANIKAHEGETVAYGVRTRLSDTAAKAAKER